RVMASITRTRCRRNRWSMVPRSPIGSWSGPVAKNLAIGLLIPSLPRCCRSFHRRHGKVAFRRAAARPSLGHDLGTGVEAHTIHSVLVEVAEARALPAAEAVVGHRHRDRYVDADHADLDALGEHAGCFAITGEQGDAVAVLVVAGQIHRLFEAVGAHDLQHRPEDLLAIG